jgi:hypothetical protein
MPGGLYDSAGTSCEPRAAKLTMMVLSLNADPAVLSVLPISISFNSCIILEDNLHEKHPWTLWTPKDKRIFLELRKE